MAADELTGDSLSDRGKLGNGGFAQAHLGAPVQPFEVALGGFEVVKEVEDGALLALRVEVDDEGKTHRGLLCDTDGKWLAKDRSGKLDMWEPADLSHIINKVSK